MTKAIVDTCFGNLTPLHKTAYLDGTELLTCTRETEITFLAVTNDVAGW